MAKGRYQDWLTIEGLGKIEQWASAGLEDVQIADNIGISRQTLYKWIKKYGDIGDAIARGRGGAQVHIENALYNRACGGIVVVHKMQKIRHREFDETTGKCINEWEELVPVAEEVYTPADTNAIKFWLTNRAPERWNDKYALEQTGTLTLEQLLAEGE